MAECYKCGNDNSERDTWRFCSWKKEFVCKQCCELCDHHSSKMLPNGTNCKMTYNPVESLIGNTSEILEYKRAYELLTPEELKRLYETLKDSFKKWENEPEIRARVRCKLAAVRMILEGKQDGKH